MSKWPVWAVAGTLLLTACSSGEEYKLPVFTIGTSNQTVAAIPVVKSFCEMLGTPSPCKIAPPDNPVRQLEGVHGGALQLGIVRADALHRAWNGQAPFKTSLKKLRLLFALNDEAITLVVSGKAGISSFQQINGKRINVGQEGSDNELLVMDVMKACKAVSSNVVLGRQEPPELPHALLSRTLDGYLEILNHPNLALAQAAMTARLEILPIEGDCVAAAVKAHPYFDTTAIPGQMYRDTDQDVATVGVKTWVVANNDLDEEMVRQLVRKVFNNLEPLRQSNPALHRLSPRKMLKPIDIPYH
ncbi:MAG: TAXI family TRAP transporter solute-binding subunit, partial [Magnetococcus sp. DMHC-8]